MRKAKEELRKLEERRAAGGRIQREALESGVQKALRREHLAEFVVAQIQDRSGRLSLVWHVDAARSTYACSSGPVWAGACSVPTAISGARGGRRACFPRAVERGGTLPAGQEGRSSAMGPFSSVVRQLLANTHLRYSDRPRTGQSGTLGNRQSKVGAEHDENAVRHRSDISPRPGEAAGAACDGGARTGSDGRTANVCRNVRLGTLEDAGTSFI